MTIEPDAIGSSDPIAAIATAPGKGALAVIRLTGNGVRDIASRILSPRSGRPFTPWRVFLGDVHDPVTLEPIDEVTAVFYQAPRSYTGEDMIEVICHGSPVVAEAVLRACFDAGARQAGPGEFTRRAFATGRIDLSQAESVALLSAAASDAERRAALAILAGGLSEPLTRIRRDLIHAIAGLELDLDFPEEEASIPIETTTETLRRALDEVIAIESAGDRAERAGRGMRVVIAGTVNAGKSRLFNRLAGAERAIVTDEPGTTRDAIEIVLGGRSLDITLVDTAGFRSTDSAAETEGIRRTLRHLDAADLILAVIDLTRPFDESLEPLTRFIGRTPIIVVCNKLDLAGVSAESSPRVIAEMFPECVVIGVSALRGDGIDRLREEIRRKATGGDAEAGAGLALTTRIRTALGICRNDLDEAIRAVTEGVAPECIVPAIRSACDRIGEILGDHAPPDVLGTIFDAFCIGK